jgi:oligopeptidase B
MLGIQVMLMPTKKLILVLLTLGLVMSCRSSEDVAPTTAAAPSTRPVEPKVVPAPVAKRIPTTARSLGEPRTDDYTWLNQKDTPPVLDYLNAENRYTDSVLAPTRSLQETLVEEFISHSKLDDSSVPYMRDGWLYFEQTDEKSDYPRYFRKRNDNDPPQLLLDLNELAKSAEFVEVGTDEPSDDGKLLAYTIDLTGFRDYKLSIKDIDSGRLLPDTADHVSSVAWANDNLTLFYSTEDDAKRSSKVWRLKLGGKPELGSTRRRMPPSASRSARRPTRRSSSSPPSATEPPASR